MSAGTRYLLDTNAVNRILDNDAVAVVAKLNVLVTFTQMRELRETLTDSRRAALLAVVTAIEAEPVATRSNHWDDADWDETSFSDDDDLCERIKAEVVRLDAVNKRKRKSRSTHNQTRDAETIETAIKAGATLVTSDASAAEACRSFGGLAITAEDLIEIARNVP